MSVSNELLPIKQKIQSSVANKALEETCLKIIDYLLTNTGQNKLTIGGLRAALRVHDKSLLEASYLLSTQAFNVLDVRYRLYDAELEEQIGEFNSEDFYKAMSLGYLIDNDGNKVKNFQETTFPYFVKLTQEKWNVR